jgi:hypothetical protein
MKTILAVLAVVGLGFSGGAACAGDQAEAGRKADERVFELRIYHVAPGKMEALQARFRDPTCKLFEKHGMTVIGFWNPTDPKQAEQKLVYLLAFPSKEAAQKSWQAFRDDPAWKTVREASEKNGKLVEKIESMYLNPTDYSPMK